VHGLGGADPLAQAQNAEKSGEGDSNEQEVGEQVTHRREGRAGRA